MSEQVVTGNERSRKKTIITLVSIVLAVAVAVAGTLAYLFHKTDAVVNEFTPAEVTCKVEETFENNIKTNVSIQNTSNIDAFIRVAVITNWAKLPDRAEVTGDATKLSLEKASYDVGEAINIIATDSVGCWVGIYISGGKNAIRSATVQATPEEINITNAAVTAGQESLANISAGTYIIRLMPNGVTDTAQAIASATVSVVTTTADIDTEVYGKTQPVEETDYIMDMNLGTNWVKAADGYYYFLNEVAPGENTDVLINECRPVAGREPEGYTLSVNIIPSAIQSAPDSVVAATWGENNTKVEFSANDGALTVTDKQGA